MHNPGVTLLTMLIVDVEMDTVFLICSLDTLRKTPNEISSLCNKINIGVYVCGVHFTKTRYSSIVEVFSF